MSPQRAEVEYKIYFKINNLIKLFGSPPTTSGVILTTKSQPAAQQRTQQTFTLIKPWKAPYRVVMGSPLSENILLHRIAKTVKMTLA